MPPIKPVIYYKSTNKDGSLVYGQGKWDLPKDGHPGAWRIAHGPIDLCKNGIHAARRKDLVWWLGEKLHTFELAGDELVQSSDKVVNRKGRLVETFENWGEEIWRQWVDDCRDYAGLYPIDWSASPSMSMWALPSMSPSASLSTSLWVSAWPWPTNRLFEYLEGKRG